LSILFRQRATSAAPDDAERSQLTFSQYTKMIEPWLPFFTRKPTDREPIERTSSGMARAAYAGNGVAFTCAALRMQVFSEVTFKWQDLATKKLYGNGELEPLEMPWVGAGSDDLLARMEQDATTAGNSYWVDAGSQVRTDRANLLRLHPEYVTIVLEPVSQFGGGRLGRLKVGYIYAEPDQDAVYLDVSEVAHFAPLPDPLAEFRGMSWLTPVLSDVEFDSSLNEMKQAFIDNAATPNLVVSFDPSVSPEKFAMLTEVIKSKATGASNAGKTLALGGGADVKVIGSTFEQLALKATQGAGETRIAAAAGVPPVLAGLSEGLQGSSLNEGNYGQARRRFADGTLRPNWRSAATALSVLVPAPTGSRLWFDDHDVPFLREDVADDATIRESNARTIRQLVDAGFDPVAAVNAAVNGDFDTLGASHSGLFSVQLQRPGADAPAPSSAPARSEQQIEQLEMFAAMSSRTSDTHIHLPDSLHVEMARSEPIVIPAPVVNVPAPVVNVAAPNVTVESPTVNVAAPNVTVEPAAVNVAAPNVTIMDDSNESPSVFKVKRDQQGRIVEVVEQ
jgi:phage portal protein BeeE